MDAPAPEVVRLDVPEREPPGVVVADLARGAVGYAVAKRTMDVALAILMLVALLPLLVLHRCRDQARLVRPGAR